MKQIYQLLLGVGFCISLYLLAFQGFAAPVLPPLVDALLRILAAVCIQYLALRTGRREGIRFAPLVITALLAIWGFFLLLTSPSWQSATFGDFLGDYVTPVLGCCAAWLLYHRLYR